MKKKNILTIALSLCLAAVIAVGATLAYFTDSSDVKTNVFEMGHVAIDLIDRLPSDYADTQNDHTWKGVEGQDGIAYENVMPGDLIGKEVGFSTAADSMDAWIAIRVQTEVTKLPFATEDFTMDTVAAEISNRIKTDVELNNKMFWQAVQDEKDPTIVTYYFRTMVPANTDNVLLFDGIQIPAEEWGNKYAGLSFNVKVQAAAVQADNVSYDQFKAMQWDDFEEYPVSTDNAGDGANA